VDSERISPTFDSKRERGIKSIYALLVEDQDSRLLEAESERAGMPKLKNIPAGCMGELDGSLVILSVQVQPNARPLHDRWEIATGRPMVLRSAIPFCPKSERGGS